MNEEQMREECAKIQAEWQMVGLVGTMYEDFAVELAKRVQAEERKRCDVLTDDMLRYAMAAMGTGSPREADNLRTFWRFAIAARNTKA